MVEDPDGLQPVDEDLMMRPMVSIPQDIPEEDEPEVDDTSDIDTKFDPRYREPFVGLLYLGHLQKRVVLYGHSFDLKTPSQRERLEAGVLHKRYANTISSEISWAAIVVALYLQEVDDRSLPEPIGPAVETKVQDRFNWVVDNIKGEIINQLFEECLLLDAQVANTLSELETQVKTAG